MIVAVVLFVLGCGPAVGPTSTPGAGPTSTPGAGPTSAPSPGLTSAPAASAMPSTPTAQGPAVSLDLVVDGLTAPVALADAGDGRLFIAEQTGQVWLVGPDGRGEDPVLDLRPRLVRLDPGYDERGLLGMVLEPDVADPGRMFVFYTAPPVDPQDAHVVRIEAYEVDDGQVDPTSGSVIAEWSNPKRADGRPARHQGGQLAFGPDGALYAGVGDGSRPEDSQDMASHRGKILRLDPTVDASRDPSARPADGSAVEVFAAGLRQPYRFSFGPDGRLVVGEVGQVYWEELNVLDAGANAGWPILEGAACFDIANEEEPLPTCMRSDAAGVPFAEPRLIHDHETGRAIIGGYHSTGDDIAALRGWYVFGEWSGPGSGGVLLGVREPDALAWAYETLVVDGDAAGTLPGYLLSLGSDRAGALYALTTANPGPSGTTGAVWRIVAPGG